MAEAVETANFLSESELRILAIIKDCGGDKVSLAKINTLSPKSCLVLYGLEDRGLLTRYQDFSETSDASSEEYFSLSDTGRTTLLPSSGYRAGCPAPTPLL